MLCFLLPCRYRERVVWDKGPFLNAEISPKELSVNEWIQQAWWRQNTQTMALGHHASKLIWLSTMIPGVTKQEHVTENELGYASRVLQQAIRHLTNLPFFGIFERTLDSFEVCI